MAAFARIQFWRMLFRPSLAVESGGAMPITTTLTQLLGIKHPILLAPMDTISGSRLTRAVSEAGGFGILGGGYGDQARLEAEAGELKGLVPFGIGFITWSLAKQPALLDLALDPPPHAL